MLSATLTFAQTHKCDITEQYVGWGNSINFIFMRDQNSPPPSEQYVDWDNNINFIFMRDQNLPPPMTNVEGGNNINFIFMRDQNSPPPQNNMLIGEITSTLSSRGIKTRHPL